MKLEPAETIKATKWPVASKQQLTAGLGLSRTKRWRGWVLEQTMQGGLKFKKRFAIRPDVIHEKKARRFKATAKKLRSYWSALRTEAANAKQLARPGLTRGQRFALRSLKRSTRKWKSILSNRAVTTDNEKKARRMKAVARKLRWLARKDFNSLSPEARRAAERHLRSKLAGEILSVTPTVTE